MDYSIEAKRVLEQYDIISDIDRQRWEFWPTQGQSLGYLIPYSKADDLEEAVRVLLGEVDINEPNTTL